MTTFSPKTYRRQVLDGVEAYFKACHELPSPSIAFSAPLSACGATAILTTRCQSHHGHRVLPVDLRRRADWLCRFVMVKDKRWEAIEEHLK